jgi:hypothetical protein
LGAGRKTVTAAQSFKNSTSCSLAQGSLGGEAPILFQTVQMLNWAVIVLTRVCSLKKKKEERSQQTGVKFSLRVYFFFRRKGEVAAEKRWFLAKQPTLQIDRRSASLGLLFRSKKNGVYDRL